MLASQDPSPSPIAKLDTRHINRGPRKDVCETTQPEMFRHIGVWHLTVEKAYVEKSAGSQMVRLLESSGI